jgi:hypothetical protein
MFDELGFGSGEWVVGSGGWENSGESNIVRLISHTPHPTPHTRAYRPQYNALRTIG